MACLSLLPGGSILTKGGGCIFGDSRNVIVFVMIFGSGVLL